MCVCVTMHMNDQGAQTRTQQQRITAWYLNVLLLYIIHIKKCN